MKVTVRYFARLREILEAERETVDCPAGESVAGLRALLAARGGKWEEALTPSRLVMVAVNEQIADAGTTLQEEDEVAFFPPVTGG